MSSIELTDQEWGVLMSILSDAPWKVANPLLMKIGEQLRQQVATKTMMGGGTRIDANGREVSHE